MKLIQNAVIPVIIPAYKTDFRCTRFLNKKEKINTNIEITKYSKEVSKYLGKGYQLYLFVYTFHKAIVST